MEREGHRLDPADWDHFRREMHELLDACLTRMQDARDLAWQPVPDGFADAMALDGTAAGTAAVFDDIVGQIMPQATGNTHPRFFGWVHGTGLPVGVGAELAAATMNANVGGRWHGAPEVERAVIHALTGIAGLPDEAFGILTTGTSQATLLALSAARVRRHGPAIRATGLRDLPQMTLYIAQGGHSCIDEAAEVLGLGRNAVRHIPLDAGYQMDLAALKDAIAADRADGFDPIAIVGTAGSVDIGAYDALDALADIARDEDLWFHVDAAFGFWSRLAAPPYRGLSDGIGRADSLALDLHKWIGVPYACGACLIADRAVHRATFSERPAYLAQGSDGLAGGDLWFCDYGTDLSRGFIALKAWASLRAHGYAAFGRAITDNCQQAALMGALVDAAPDLELAAPVLSNICVFRTPGHDPAALAARLQIDGAAVFSTTTINGAPCLRAAIVNHRTTQDDIRMSIAAVQAAMQGQRATATVPAVDQTVRPIQPD